MTNAAGTESTPWRCPPVVRSTTWAPGQVFKDPSASAWKPTVVRPQWEALMARLESGASDGVWVYDLTRFSRKVMLTRASVAGLIEYDEELVGERVGVDPIVSREELLRLRAMFDARRRGRPPGLGDYLLSGVMVCVECGISMNGMPRPRCLPNPDGSPRREYRCRRSVRNGGCGSNYIDAWTAEQMVAEAVKARLGDPRRADRIAARLAVVTGERARISGEIARLEEAADGLAVKTAEWGLDRVDKAMAPIQARLANLTAELAALDEPEAAETAAESAVRAWDDAVTARDRNARRAMIRRAFPNLAIRPPEHWLDHNPARFLWDGPAKDAPAPAEDTER